MRAKVLAALILAFMAGCWVAIGQSFVGRPLKPLGGSAVTPSLTNNLIAYWKFDETSGTRADSWDSLPLTDNNTVTSNTGIITNAASFASASTEYFTAGRTVVVDNSALSLAFWIFPADNGVLRYIYNEGWTGGNGDNYGLSRTSGNQFAWWIHDGAIGGVYPTVTSSTNASSGSWYFVVVEYDKPNNLIKISVNGGNLQTASSAAVLNPGASGQTYIGAYAFDLSTYAFNGRIDEGASWGKLLTQAEIVELYRGGSGLTCCNPGFYIP